MEPVLLFERIRQKFLERGDKEILHVYDVDDVLWMLMLRVVQKLRLDWEVATAVFAIRENQLLTPYQQDAIIEAFGDPRTFENIELIPGAAEILRPRELGARVELNSNSFNDEIAELKMECLLAGIPGLRPSDIQMNIISHHESKKKPLNPRMTTFTDDSPYNVSKSEALINLMPKYMPWSCGPEAILTIGGKPTIWRKDLIAINQFNYALTEYLVGGERHA